MDDGWDEKLQQLGFDAYSVKKLRTEGKKLRTDYSVINYAKENKIDAMVVGIRKKSKLGKMVSGSTAQYVLLGAPCPVISQTLN